MKVEILITEGHKYTAGNKEFVAVDYSGSKYGGGSPCNNDEEVNSSIANAKKTIIEHGDIPFVTDKRKRSTLMRWF